MPNFFCTFVFLIFFGLFLLCNFIFVFPFCIFLVCFLFCIFIVVFFMYFFRASDFFCMIFYNFASCGTVAIGIISHFLTRLDLNAFKQVSLSIVDDCLFSVSVVLRSTFVWPVFQLIFDVLT